MTDTRPDAAQALRQRAEAMLRANAVPSPEDLATLTPDDLCKLLHELRVHQIELTMQNEELRRAQAETDAARARYFDLYDLAPVSYCTLSETGLILEANLTATHLLGVPKSALIKQPFTRFIVKDDQDRYYFHRQQLLRTGAESPRAEPSGDSPGCELRMVKADGTTFWARLEAIPEWDSVRPGATPRSRVILNDISERKALEAVRDEALNRLQKIACRVPGMLYQYRLRPDGSSCFPYVSDAVSSILYVSPEDVREDASNAFAMVHPDDLADLVASIQTSAQALTSWQCEYRVRFADGTDRWLSGNALPEREADGSVLWHGFINDVTERKQAEETIARSAEENRILLNSIQTQIWYLSDDHTYGAVNKAHAEFNGLKIEDMAFKNIYDFFPEDVVEVCRQGNVAVFTTGKPVRSEEWMPHVTGGRRLLSILKSPKSRADGTVEYVVCAAEDITEQRRAEDALREQRDFSESLIDTLQRREQSLEENRQALADVLDNASIHIWAFDGIRYSYLNKAYYDFTGLRTDQELALETWTQFVHPDDLASAGAVWQDASAAKTTHDNYFRLRHVGGEYHDFWCHAVPIFDRNGEFTHFQGFNVDITDRKQAESRQRLAASVFTHASEGIMITTADGTIIDVNDAFTRITSYAREEVLGRNPRLLTSGQQGCEFYESMWRSLREDGHWSGELWNRRKNGDVFAAWQTINAVRDPQGNTQHYVSLFSDITALKEHECQLEHLARYDLLTALPNRGLLADRLHQAMAQTLRRTQLLGLAYLDLDGFKDINDHHGHATGDQVLIAVAERMQSVLREGDTLARLGGDEFAVVLVDLTDIDASVTLFNRLLAATAEPLRIGDLIVRVSVSIGATFYPQADEVSGDQLLRQADQAMYQAKQFGKNGFCLFDAEQDRNIRGHHDSLERIRQALNAREFLLYYQPKINLRTGTLMGCEALIRWQHPEHGLLAPALFLPTIENHPLAITLGDWVIETALTQMDTWRTLGLDLPVSVNVGARQLQQADFVARLRAALAAHPGIKPSSLGLEVLETSVLEDLASTSLVIEACRELGVSFALDDFGTGYSSLTYLKRLAVTQLKIDQSFVRDMLNDPEDLTIVESVLSLASAFHREVIAEGVETLEHGEMLLLLGCELAQGYGIARPMPAHEIPDWRPAAQWSNLPTLNRDDLPLLVACVEHRAWIAALDKYLSGERDIPPPLERQQCPFSTWLRAEWLIDHGRLPNLPAIDRLHGQVHALAAELLALKARNRAPEALARLAELHALRDHLLERARDHRLERMHERTRDKPAGPGSGASDV
jgi:diguanylate cyclase (GGDEF)-like protein/PAS domain S-box-containing protein